MAEVIKVIKPEKYEKSFISMDKDAFIQFCSRTQMKNAVVLYSLLAGNTNGFNIVLSVNNVMSIWGIKDRNMANAITRSATIDELKRLNYINENNEFNEYGWGEKDKIQIENDKKSKGKITILKKEEELTDVKAQLSKWGL